MKKREILYITSFNSLPLLVPKLDSLFNELIKNFNGFFIVNVDNLKINNFKKKKYEKNLFKNFNKKIKFINPQNFKELRLFLNGKSPIIINNFGRYFVDFLLLFFIHRNKIPQIIVANVGNMQAPDRTYTGKLIYIIKNLIYRKFPYFLATIFSNINIFSKIDIKFTSNYKLLKSINSNNFLKKHLSYIKEHKLVKSIHFDISEKKEKTKKEKYILLLDLDPDIKEITFLTGEYDLGKKKIHYKNLNFFLEKLSKIYRKKVIVSIHPKYNFENAKKRFKNFKVINENTRKYIYDSFIVIFYDSSAIVDALIAKKRIININSNLFSEKKYPTDAYQKLINFKSFNISKKIKINKKNLIKKLDSKILNYDIYNKTYLGKKNTLQGFKSIVKVIKSRYC